MSILFCLLVIILIPACATAPENIESPSGPVSGDQFGSMEIIGIISRTTTTLNRRNSNPPYSEDVELNVPVGTEFIIPVVSGWRLGFGELDPNTLEHHIGTSADPNRRWKDDDHHYGHGGAIIYVKDINAPTSGNSPTQTATITIFMGLGDHNLDDRWFGRVHYYLLCLKRVQPGSSSSPSPSPPPIP